MVAISERRYDLEVVEAAGISGILVSTWQIVLNRTIMEAEHQGSYAVTTGGPAAGRVASGDSDQ